MEHLFPQIQVKTKKRSSPKWNTFFPNSSGHLRSDAHQSQVPGGDADVDHTQTIGGDISPPGFGTPAYRLLISTTQCELLSRITGGSNCKYLLA